MKSRGVILSIFLPAIGLCIAAVIMVWAFVALVIGFAALVLVGLPVVFVREFVKAWRASAPK